MCPGLLMQPKPTAGPDGVREPRPHHSNGKNYSSVEPASPKIPRPGDLSKISTTSANGPGSSRGPGLCAFLSLTTRSRAAANSSLVIPVAMISATITSPNGPRTSMTSSCDSSATSAPLRSSSPLYSAQGMAVRQMLRGWTAVRALHQIYGSRSPFASFLPRIAPQQDVPPYSPASSYCQNAKPLPGCRRGPSQGVL